MDYYSPDYKLHVPVSNMENENTREQLEMKKQKLFEARDASPRRLPENVLRGPRSEDRAMRRVPPPGLGRFPPSPGRVFDASR